MKLNIGSKHFQPLLCLLLIVSLFFLSCSVSPGDGGTSTITGYVSATAYNSSGIPYADYFAPEQNVYIIYGDGTTQSDNTKTSYDGSYQFPFLRKGTYTIYVYSDCPACDGGKQAIKAEVEITKNHEDVTASEIHIDKY